MALKWYHDRSGDVSTMRIMAMWGAVMGSLLLISGTVGMFMGIKGFEVALGSGAGLFSMGELSKALQAQKGL